MKVEEDEVLVSYDIVALYPSIPQNEAIDLINDCLMKDTNLKEKTSIPAKDLVDLFKICVKKTYFSFNKKLYQQINGLAIGAATSGFAAEIFLQKLEKIALSTFFCPPEVWRRFVDDTFAKIKRILLQQFKEHLNKQNQYLKWTEEVEVDNQLAFLETKVHKREDGSVQTTIFRKKTHTDQYLQFSSNHHIQHKLGIYSCFKNRAETLISKEEDIPEEIEYVKTALKRCGHPEWIFNREKNDDPKVVPEYVGEVKIPYVKSVSEKLAKIYRKFDVKPIHTINNKVQQHLCSKTKDQLHHLDKSNIIYYTGCITDIDDYTGETERANRRRQYEHGLIEHQESEKNYSIELVETPIPTQSEIPPTIEPRRSTRKKAPINYHALANNKDQPQEQQEQPQELRRSQRNRAVVDYKKLHEGEKGPLTLGNSAVCRHIRSKEHNKEELFFKIMESEPDRRKREYKEAIAIRVMKPTLNEDEGKIKYFPHIYDRLFKTPQYEAATPYKKFKQEFIKKCEENNTK